MKKVLSNISSPLSILLWSLKPFERKDKVFAQKVFELLCKMDSSYKSFLTEFSRLEVSLKKLVELAYLEAFEDISPLVGVEHLFLSLMSLVGRKDYERAKIFAFSQKRERGLKWKILFEIITDLTALEEVGLLSEVIIREKETNLLIQKLLQTQQGSLLLVGHRGVGKTSLMKGLAKKIAHWDVPKALLGVRIISVDVVALANAPFSMRGFLEDNLGAVIEQWMGPKRKAILFFDNLHLLPVGMPIGFSARGGRKFIRCIGATQDAENTRLVDNPLGALWETFNVGEPSLEDMRKIANIRARELEFLHNVSIDKAAVNEIFKQKLDKLSDISDALDLICAHKKFKDTPSKKDMDKNEERLLLKNNFRIALQKRDLDAMYVLDRKIKALERTIGEGGEARKAVIGGLDAKRFFKKGPLDILPFGRRVNSLERVLMKSIIGQKEAVLALASSVRRAVLKFKGENRPVGAFLFLGATGVGKTETAKVLAKALFGEGRNFIRLDMSDFRERHTVSRLVGAPPGYVGFEEGGQLTDFVAENPQSVVLFDEVEKSHPDVLNILLQIMEEGELVDAGGMKVSFKDALIILTGNIGSDLISKGSIGFHSEPAKNSSASYVSYALMKERILNETKKILKPEFINRFDGIIVFKLLEKADLYKICGILVNDFEKVLLEKGIALKVLPEAKRFLVDRSFSLEYGARPLRRFIEKELMDKIAGMVLKEEVKFGDVVRVSLQKSGTAFQLKMRVKRIRKII